MSSPHRKYTAADINILPWPQPIPAAGDDRITQWVMTFNRQLTETDARLAVERVQLQDPSLDMDVSADGNLMCITFTWKKNYGGGELSRSVVALQLIIQVVGQPVQLLGRAATDWPFLK